jgi:hypothetical protein
LTATRILEITPGLSKENHPCNARTCISKTIFLAGAVGGALFVFCLPGMHAANILTNSGFETANLAGWATFGPDNYSQSGAGVAPGGINYYFINPLL